GGPGRARSGWSAGGDQLPLAGRPHRQAVHAPPGQGRGGYAASRPADHSQGLRAASEAARQAAIRLRGGSARQSALAQRGNAGGGEIAVSAHWRLPRGSLLLPALFAVVVLSALAVTWSAHHH